MYCPDCGTYAESNFCPNCGLNLQTVKVGRSPDAKTKNPQHYGKYYLGDAEIDRNQFLEIRQLAEAGEKMEAIKRIRSWTDLSLAGAKYIMDHFDSIDFRTPQVLLHANQSHKKAQKAGNAVAKGIGLTAFFGCYGVLRIISSLVKPYMGKRK